MPRAITRAVLIPFGARRKWPVPGGGNSAGTATGDDQEFQAGPGAWAPFSRCPVDDPAMLASDGISSIVFCLGSNSTHGSISIGTITTTTGSTNLQAGMLLDTSTYAATIRGAPTREAAAEHVP